jgi:hypothetical protein
MTGSMPGRASLPLFAALPLPVLALAGCGGNASHELSTTSDARPASIGVESTDLGDVLVDWFAVSPAGATVAPRSQPQGGGGYGNSY